MDRLGSSGFDPWRKFSFFFRLSVPHGRKDCEVPAATAPDVARPRTAPRKAPRIPHLMPRHGAGAGGRDAGALHLSLALFRGSIGGAR